MSYRREWMPKSAEAQAQRGREAARLELQAEVLGTALIDLTASCAPGCLFRLRVGKRMGRYRDIAAELRDQRRRMVPVLVERYGVLDAVEEAG